MKVYNVDMSIEAQSPTHLEEKLTAFKSLSGALQH